MTEIYLIRHTQAEGNRYRMMQGYWDGEVTALGLRQADALGRRFAKLPLDAVYSSDLTRAVLTAEAAACGSGCLVQKREALRELNIGPWERQFFGNLSYEEPELTDRFIHDAENWELPGAESFIREVSKDVVVSVSHTCADYETAQMAFRSGATHLTHTFDAMPDLQHRAPGPIPAALEAGADAELIADGIHVHPAMVRLAFRLFGEERMILISDSMEATGLPDGTYSLGGQDVTKRGRRAVLATDPDTIAGSVTNLFDCMRTAVLDMKVPLETAVRAATENPARSIGIEKDYGAIAPGRYVNVVLMDREMNVRGIVQRGRVLER